MKDEKKAKKYYKKACELNFSYSMVNLARIYFEIPEKRIKVRNLLKSAIKLGNVSALFKLAVLYDYKFNNDVKAKKYYKKSIEHDNLNAMNNIAFLYNKNKKFDKALKYFSMAFDKNKKNIDIIFNLAMQYKYNGDYTNAEKYFIMASNSGCDKSMYELGIIYATNKNAKIAEKYFILSMEHGNINSKLLLARLYRALKNYSLSEKYFLESIKYFDIADEIIKFYQKNEKHEEAVIFASQYKKESLFELLLKIKYPISNTKIKNDIYIIVDNFEFPDNVMVSSDLLKICKDIMSIKHETLVKIAYFYKNSLKPSNNT